MRRIVTTRDLPSAEYIRRIARFAQPVSQPTRESAPRNNPRLRHSERTVLVMPRDMLKAVKDYQCKHGLASGQAAMRKLLANALGMKWEDELKGQPDFRPASPLAPEIRRRFGAGEKLSSIAKDLGISVSYASMIKGGER